jgi:hypothetical protein
MLKKLIFIFLGIVVLGFIGYKYVYQEHRNIAEEEAEHMVSAKELAADFEKNTSQAETDYLNKTIVVTGKITALGEKNMTLDNKVFCQFNEPIEWAKLHSTVKIKGRCIGFDDLLGQAKMDQCSIIKIE